MSDLAGKLDALNSAEMPMIENHLLPTIWVDSASFAVRGDLPVALIRFFTVVNNRSVEAVRVQTSQKHLMALIDALATITDHYPQRPATSVPKG